MEGYAYCTCNDGFYGDGKKYCFSSCGLGYWPDEFTGQCQNIDECMTQSHDCHQRAECNDNPGSFKCVCIDGYIGDGKYCVNENECFDGQTGCHFDAECIDNDGSFKCQCRYGFWGDGFDCEDINECSLGVPRCGPVATCIESRGGYECVCGEGFDLYYTV